MKKQYKIHPSIVVIVIFFHLQILCLETFASVDTHKSVGQISYQTNVSPLGVLSYTVPVPCSPSPSGLVPNVTLNYSSATGEGAPGMGWSIGGISAINRTNFVNYYDGKVEAANFSDTCAFSLDGLRLVKKENSNFYETEQGNILVEISNLNKPNLTFNVFYPNGNKAVYANPLKNRVSADIAPSISYPVHRMEDKLGNWIEYEYNYVNNISISENYLVPSITKITYGIKDDVSGQITVGSIEFSYKRIVAKNISYFYGEKVFQDLLLTKIESKDIDNKINTIFTLEHKYDTRKGFYFLQKIQQQGALGKESFNPLVFNYDYDKVEAFEVSKKILTNITTPIDSTMLIWPTKFSSKDFSTGLMIMPSKTTYFYGHNGHNGNLLTWAGLSHYGEKDSLYIYNDLGQDKLSSISLASTSYRDEDGSLKGAIFRGIWTMDYQGTGDNYIVKVLEGNRGWKDNSISYLFHIYDRNGILVDTYNDRHAEDSEKAKISSGDYYYSKSRSYLVGDFFGYGYDCFMYITHSRNIINGRNMQARVTVFDLKQKKIIINTNFPYLDYSEDIVSADFDGDGKSEIVTMSEVATHVYGFDENNNLTELVHQMEIVNWIDRNTNEKISKILYADLNGDGKIDILISPSSKSYLLPLDWTIYHSNGKDGFVEAGKIPRNRIPFNMDDEHSLVDIDGDGLPDLVIMDKEGQIKIYKNVNGTFSTEPISIPEKVNPKTKFFLSKSQDNNKLYPIIALDSNGKQIILIKNTLDYKYDRLMKSSINSFSVDTKYTYGNLTDPIVCKIDYEKSFSFPYNSFVEDMYVVNRVETNYNNSILESKTYRYDTPVLHRQGLGFRGFSKLLVTDDLRKQTVTQTFDPERFGVLTETSSPTAEASFKYKITIANNKASQILLEEQVSRDKLKGIESASYYLYDNYGNPVNTTTDYGQGLTSTSSFKYDNQNNPSLGIYQLGVLREQVETSTRDGETISNKTKIDYNTLFLPTNKKEYYNDNLVSETEYLYNALHQLEEVKDRVFESQDWLSKYYAYDNIGRVTKETDALGLFTESIYEGNLLKQTKNHKGHTITYTYDAWDRNTLTTYADGHTSSTQMQWDSSIPNSLYSVITKEMGSPDTKTYYDAFGREIRSGSQRFDGSFLYTDQVYDYLGRVAQASLPFKGASPTLWDVYSYDSYDRPLQVNYASGKKDNFYYNKLQTTTVIDGITTLKELDATGQVIRVEDASGEIIYNLRADGQPKSIVAPGGVETSFEYDKYGRQTAIVDPSAGRKSFVYDKNGNIEKETDARGKSTTFLFDKYGRLLDKKIEGQFDTKYEYTPDNLLRKESSTNGTSKAYEYDQYFRPQKVKESIVDGKWLEQTFAYRPDGNVDKIIYQSQSGNLVTENYGYANGIHTELKINGSKSVWKLTQENDLGMPTKSQTGVIERIYGYDQFGLPERRALQVEGQFVQDFGYKFDATTGNLSWRKDNVREITETFSYDQLNRLTHFGDHSIDYDRKGNITHHSQIGVFAYNNAKPYAIEKVAPYEEHIPMRKQEIAYNTQMRPQSISENGYVATFDYTTAGDRMKMHIKKDDKDFLTRYYLGGFYEIDIDSVGKTTERLYLGGDAYTVAAVLIKESGSDRINYIGRDYLGSITHVMDETGVVIQELSYDAWGRFRDPKTQVVYSSDIEIYPVLGWRGYTGHEHLPMFGLVNMNARLYDPVVGRFLSPDPYVQAPDFSQNFNRYSYVYNNPLRYTDPSGEWALVDDVIAAVVGGVFNVVGNAIAGNINSWGEGLSYFGIGAVSGLATIYAGPVIGGALVASGNSVINQGFENGFNNISWNAVGNEALMGGITGGISSKVGSVLQKPLNSAVRGIASPILREGVKQGLTGVATGFITNAAMTKINGGNWEESFSAGGKGATWGAVYGFSGGAVKGYRYAVDHDLNPLTGKWTGEISSNPSFRTDPNNLTEQIGQKSAMSGQGKQIMEGKINDPNWRGWNKMEYIHKSDVLDINVVNGVKNYQYINKETVKIHYWKNPSTGETSGFKFK